MSHWLGEVWIRIQDILAVLPLFFVSLENRVCLSCGVQVTGAPWRAVIRIVAGVGDLVQRTGDGRICQVLCGRAIKRLGGAVCGDEEHEFLGWASKPRSTVCEWFDLKTTWTIFSGLASKPVARVSRIGPQNWQLRFGDLSLKIIMTASWFGPPNYVGFGLSVAPQNQRREDNTGHTSRSGRLFRLEANHVRVSQCNTLCYGNPNKSH
jgi:hypothetical protein